MIERLLIIIGSILLFISSCSDENGQLDASRDIELKKIIQLLKTDTNDDSFLNQKEALSRIYIMNAVELVPELTALLKDNDPIIRIYAMYALLELSAKESIPEIVKILYDNNNWVRKEAIETLVAFQAKESVPILLELLNETNNTYVIAPTAVALGEFQARESIPQLLKILNNKNLNIHTDDNRYSLNKIALALAKLGARESVPYLVDKIIRNYPSFGDGEKAAFFIGNLDAKEKIPELVQILKDTPFGYSNYLAAIALHQLSADDLLIPEIIKAIGNNSSDDETRRLMIRYLGQIKAKEIIPDLNKVLSLEKDEEVRTVIILTLGRLGDREMIPELLKFIKDESYWQSASESGEILADLQAREAIPELMNQVKNNSHDFMRADAAYALVKFQVKDAVIELLSLLKTTEDSGLRRQIIIKSGDLGIKEFISDLCELMEHDNSAESFEAVISLVKLGKTNIPENIISKMQRGLYSRFIHNDIKEKMRITLKMLGRDEK